MKAGRALGLLAATTVSAAGCGTSYSEEVPVAADGGAPPPLKCGDPGSQCVVVPPGWLVVSPVPSPACPPYFSDRRALLDAPGASGETCTCTCGGAPTVSPCLTGTLTVGFDSNGSGCSDKTEVLEAAGGACTPMSAAWRNGVYRSAQGTGVGASPTACSSSTVLPPLTAGARVDICTSPPPAPCAAGACVAVPSAIATCLLREGEHTCPGDLPVRRVLFSERDIRDERTCGACTCAATADGCDNPRIAFYDDAACTSNPRVEPLDGACPARATDVLAGASHYTYLADAAGVSACTTSGPAPTVTGAIVLPVPQTLCCR